jgi:hypothetical protein
MLEAIRSWNVSAREQRPPRPAIRIIVLNTCDSVQILIISLSYFGFVVGTLIGGGAEEKKKMGEQM